MHFKEVCIKCKAVCAQCRCPSESKAVRLVVCEKCKKEEVSGSNS